VQIEITRVIDNISDVDAATDSDSDDGDGDENTSSDSGSGASSGLSSAAAEEVALVERVKQAAGFWPVITTTESPPGDQSAAGADGGSSDRLRDALALDEVRVMKIYRPRLFLEGSAAATIRRQNARAQLTRAHLGGSRDSSNFIQRRSERTRVRRNETDR
jgi:hypothetical protein